MNSCCELTGATTCCCGSTGVVKERDGSAAAILETHAGACNGPANAGRTKVEIDVTWIAAREEQLLDEGLLSVGRRTAMERLAYLLLAMFQRAEEVGLTKGNSIQFPFTQQHVADTLGMSLVHTNKTLQRLSATKTMRWKERKFEILDREALTRIANYEKPEPRARRPFI